MSQNEKRYRTLWGGMVSGDKVVGYCRLHKRHLTAQQMQTKQCIPKGCGAFKKWDCQYWRHKERLKEVKRIKKEQGIPTWQKVEIRTDHNGELVPTMRKKLKKKR
jgi:coproporphyrinogen III oxidase-like Fe-S oxidoreductase